MAANNVDEERRSSEEIQKKISSNKDRAGDIVQQAQDMLIRLEQRMDELHEVNQHSLASTAVPKTPLSPKSIPKFRGTIWE